MSREQDRIKKKLDRITKNNAKKIVCAGRNRWKIENQGFNRQKRLQGNIEHACSF